LNVVNAQMSPLCNRSNVDKQLQPNFPRNELSLAVDKIHWSLCAGGRETDPKGPSAKCKTRKALLRKKSITSLSHTTVSPNSVYTSLLSYWLCYNTTALGRKYFA